MKLFFTALIATLAVTSSVAIDNADTSAAADIATNVIPESNLNIDAGVGNDLDATGDHSAGENGLRGRRELWFGRRFWHRYGYR